VHPLLTLLLLTLLLRLIPMMMKTMKEVEKKKTMTSEASWKPTHLGLVLIDKEGGRSIKAWRPSSFIFQFYSA
jgi:hypothetical protein